MADHARRQLVVVRNAMNRENQPTIAGACLLMVLASSVLAPLALADDERQLFTWDDIAEAYPGIQILPWRAEEPWLQALVVARIDLQQPQLRVVTTPPLASGWQAGSAETMAETTRDFIARQQGDQARVVLAINGNFFHPVGNHAQAVRLSGLAVADGVLVSPSEPRRVAFIIDRDGRARMEHTGPDTDLGPIWQAVGGYVWNLRHGQPEGSDDRDDRQPRTALGLCAAGRYLFLLVIDGRQGGHSEGATIRQAGAWLRHFGAEQGMNLDGGGSTTMAWWHPQQEAVELLNRPANRLRILGQPIGARRERWNGHHVGIELRYGAEAASNP